MTRPATSLDTLKLHELAERGVYLSEAARIVGVSSASAHYWNVREHLGLVSRPWGVRLIAAHPAPDIIACWRLHQTMQRVTDAARGSHA